MLNNTSALVHQPATGKDAIMDGLRNAVVDTPSQQQCLGSQIQEKPSFSWINSLGLLCSQAFVLAVGVLRASSAINSQQEAMWAVYADATAGLVFNFNFICLFLFYIESVTNNFKEEDRKGGFQSTSHSQHIDKSFLGHLSLLTTLPRVSHVLVYFSGRISLLLDHLHQLFSHLTLHMSFFQRATQPCFCFSTGY